MYAIFFAPAKAEPVEVPPSVVQHLLGELLRSLRRVDGLVHLAQLLILLVVLQELIHLQPAVCTLNRAGIISD